MLEINKKTKAKREVLALAWTATGIAKKEYYMEHDHGSTIFWEVQGVLHHAGYQSSTGENTGRNRDPNALPLFSSLYHKHFLPNRIMRHSQEDKNLHVHKDSTG